MGSERLFNITRKFIAYLLVTAIIPLLVVTVASYVISKNVIQRRVSSYALELTNRQKDYLELTLAEVESLIANISSVDEIKNVLASPPDVNDDYVRLATQARIGYILSGYTNLHGLVSIDIFAQDGTHYHVGDTLNVKEIRVDVKNRIYNEAVNADRVLWTGVEDNVNANSKNARVITAARVLKEFDNQTLREKPVGLLLVNYSIDSLYEHFQQSYLGQDAYMVIIDDKQRIVFHPDRSLIGSVLNPAHTAGLSADSPSYTVDVQGTSMFVTHAYSRLSNWTVFNFVPMDTLTIDAVYIRRASLLVLLACALFITLFALNFSRSVVAPIKQVTDHFKELQGEENEKISRLEEKYNDEIGDLIRWFNTYLDSLGQKRQAEEALRQSREKYRSLVENMKEGVFQTDLNGVIVFLNPAWTKITGHPVEESIGCSIYMFIHPADRIECETALSDLVHRKKPFCHHQTRFLTCEKDWRIVEIFSSLNLDASGNPMGMVGTMNDITEQAQFLDRLREAKELAEAAFLKKSQELITEHQQLLDIIEFLPDATFVVDRDRKVIAWNRAMEEMSGVLKDQVLGQGDYIYAIPFYGQRTPTLIDSLFEHTYHNSDQLTEKKGNTVYAEVFAPFLNQERGAYLSITASLLNDPSGSVMGAIQSIRDITGTKQAAEALAAEKERLAVTLRSIGDGVITTDTNRKILLMNKAAEKITGWTQEEAGGRGLDEVVKIEGPKILENVEPNRTEDANNASIRAFSDRKVLLTREGTGKIITDNNSPVMDQSGRWLGNVLVFRDITEQNKMEAQLALSQKMESIGHLAAGIAHEINTPLQYVGDNTVFLQNGFASLVRAIEEYRKLLKNADLAEGMHLSEDGMKLENNLKISYLIEEIPEAIAQSREGLSRVSQIVLAMKDFSHPGYKEMMYADINKAIESTIIISRNEWKYIAEIETCLDPNLPPVNCAVDEINQVLLNMIINAVHAINAKPVDPLDKGKITIKTSHDRGWVHISISDTGTGIPASIMNHIFDPFFTTKDVGVGTGQGLALAHNIIHNQHKGRITVESVVDRGSTFTISLPINGVNERSNI